jgi:cobalt ECF transporter T component CbiQ
VRPEVGLCPCGCLGTRRKTSFVEKTLTATAGVLRHAMSAEDLANRPGLLQGLDPAVKLVTVLGLLVAAALARSLPVLVAMYAATLMLALASRLSLTFFVKRVWLFVPIFTGIVVVPATLNVVTPGTVVLPLGTWFGHAVGVTSEGLRGAGLIVARVAVSISLVVLLTVTTPWNRLLAALRRLHVPRVFVLIVGMAYRYIFHLLDAVSDMYLARRSRTVLPDRNTATGRRFVAASAGALFGKAHALSEDVYLAMVSRGYRGDPPLLERSRPGALDAAWTAGCVVVGSLLLWVDRVVG